MNSQERSGSARRSPSSQQSATGVPKKTAESEGRDLIGEKEEMRVAFAPSRSSSTTRVLAVLSFLVAVACIPFVPDVSVIAINGEEPLSNYRTTPYDPNSRPKEPSNELVIIEQPHHSGDGGEGYTTTLNTGTTIAYLVPLVVSIPTLYICPCTRWIWLISVLSSVNMIFNSLEDGVLHTAEYAQLIFFFSSCFFQWCMYLSCYVSVPKSVAEDLMLDETDRYPHLVGWTWRANAVIIISAALYSGLLSVENLIGQFVFVWFWKQTRYLLVPLQIIVILLVAALVTAAKEFKDLEGQFENTLGFGASLLALFGVFALALAGNGFCAFCIYKCVWMSHREARRREQELRK